MDEGMPSEVALVFFFWWGILDSNGSCCDGLLCADVCLGEGEILNGMMT